MSEELEDVEISEESGESLPSGPTLGTAFLGLCFLGLLIVFGFLVKEYIAGGNKLRQDSRHKEYFQQFNYTGTRKKPEETKERDKEQVD